MLVITTSNGGFELLEQLEETEKRLKAGKMGGGVSLPCWVGPQFHQPGKQGGWFIMFLPTE